MVSEIPRPPWTPGDTHSPAPTPALRWGRETREGVPFVIPVQLTQQRPEWGRGWGSDLEDGGPGQMMLPGPPQPKQRPEAWEGRKGLPFFSDPGIERPSPPVSCWGGPPPPLHPPPTPHLKCEGIRICNVRLRGGGGLLQWPLNLEGGAGLGLPRWAEGRQAQEGCGWGEGGPQGRPPAWVWNLGLGSPSLEAWVQDPVGYPPGFLSGHFPLSGPLSVSWIGLGRGGAAMLCDFEFSFLIPGSFEMKNVRCHHWGRGLENGLEC